MTAKEYLLQIPKIKNRVQALSQQLAYMREVAGIATSVISDFPRSPNRNIHKLENDVMRHLEWEEKIERELARLEKINASIAAVADPTLQTLLVKRYVAGENWEQIASEMYVCIRQAHILHGHALREIEKSARLCT